jgi:hypothetical protein
LKNWKGEKWLPTTPFFEGGKNWRKKSSPFFLQEKYGICLEKLENHWTQFEKLENW